MSIANPQEKTTRSIANILNAYKVARTFLTREFGENPTAIRVFYGYLTNKVKLIRIQTENVAKTLKVFETRHLELRCSTGFSTTYKSVVIISGSLNVYPGGSASGRSSQAF